MKKKATILLCYGWISTVKNWHEAVKGQERCRFPNQNILEEACANMPLFPFLVVFYGDIAAHVFELICQACRGCLAETKSLQYP